VRSIPIITRDIIMHRLANANYLEVINC